jgi:hypothetical protein
MRELLGDVRERFGSMRDGVSMNTGPIRLSNRPNTVEQQEVGEDVELMGRARALEKPGAAPVGEGDVASGAVSAPPIPAAADDEPSTGPHGAAHVVNSGRTGDVPMRGPMIGIPWRGFDVFQSA